MLHTSLSKSLSFLSLLKKKKSVFNLLSSFPFSRISFSFFPPHSIWFLHVLRRLEASQDALHCFPITFTMSSCLRFNALLLVMDHVLSMGTALVASFCVIFSFLFFLFFFSSNEIM